ncbi:MAG TPA: sialidase family protein [Terriglobales bacterium]|nr:sialidase family protein [Terriglobales bacterium]
MIPLHSHGDCRLMHSAAFLFLLLSAAMLGCGGGSTQTIPAPTPAPVPQPLAGLTRLSSDTFTNASSQHATEVEPGASSAGPSIVAAFQVGRIFNGGGADIGFATSTDSGATWTSGFLPGITVFQAGAFTAVSDSAVAFDPAHNVWLIASLAIGVESQIVVSRSSDALHWDNPVIISPVLNSDKPWIACDTRAISPYFGSCYAEWDDPDTSGGLIWMATSRDGGQTWSAPVNTADHAAGVGGEPVIQPDGTLVVPIENADGTALVAFRSNDGGTSWSGTSTISGITDHLVAGNLRTSPLPTAATDASGTVYVAWQDCRFRLGCVSNDIVLATSGDGITWSSPSRIPLDPLTSAADHFIPALAVDPTTSGTTAHLALTYYEYGSANCTQTTCALSTAITTSDDGGSTWSSPKTLAGPMSLTWLPDTFAGLMVGDYAASVYSGGTAFGIVAVAQANSGAEFDEAIFATSSGVSHEQGAARLLSEGEYPVPNAVSDHTPHRFYDVEPERPKP